MKVGEIIPANKNNKFHFGLVMSATMFTIALFVFGTNMEIMSPVASVIFGIMGLFLILIVVAIVGMIFHDNKHKRKGTHHG
jgi:membrane protein DedA with SNARE-associated domain